ncbi:hypothetical protein [Propionicimonas sp.]|uniref:hypothetical protein n=1 Tax=Propionicimonas sp. TaxID=1955623 RepID=UPI002B20D4DD|nr:hypothetical protein [Propionicimonas sp.]
MTRWTGFGQDRLYVRNDADEAVGWWDLLADEGHPQTAAQATGLAEAVAEWQAIEQAAVPAAPEPEPEPIVEPVPDEPVDEAGLDLESPECFGSLLPHYAMS